MTERKVIRVPESELPDGVFKCAVCCVLPDRKGCAKFEFENGFDCCNENKHYYRKVEK